MSFPMVNWRGDAGGVGDVVSFVCSSINVSIRVGRFAIVVENGGRSCLEIKCFETDQ